MRTHSTSTYSELFPRFQDAEVLEYRRRVTHGTRTPEFLRSSMSTAVAVQLKYWYWYCLLVPLPGTPVRTFIKGKMWPLVKMV